MFKALTMHNNFSLRVETDGSSNASVAHYLQLVHTLLQKNTKQTIDVGLHLHAMCQPRIARR